MSPSDTDVIKNVFANILTLTTCNPRFSASTRLVVQAKLVHSQLFPNSGLPHGERCTRTRRAATWPGTPTSQLTDTLFWGFARRGGRAASSSTAPTASARRRWVIYGCRRVAGMLVLLWFFFGAVSPLLPASF